MTIKIIINNTPHTITVTPKVYRDLKKLLRNPTGKSISIEGERGTILTFKAKDVLPALMIVG
jgi:hypothetical protein